MLQLNKKKVGKNEELKSEGGGITESEIDDESRKGDVELLDGREVEKIQNRLKKSKTVSKRRKSNELKVDDRLSYSFNSSDMKAYANEEPIPVVKQAYMQYQRNKVKAILRRHVAEKV